MSLMMFDCCCDDEWFTSGCPGPRLYVDFRDVFLCGCGEWKVQKTSVTDSTNINSIGVVTVPYHSTYIQGGQRRCEYRTTTTPITVDVSHYTDAPCTNLDFSETLNLDVHVIYNIVTSKVDRLLVTGSKFNITTDFDLDTWTANEQDDCLDQALSAIAGGDGKVSASP